MKKRIGIYKIELSYYPSRNWLMFLPNIWLHIWWNSFSLTIYWFFIELHIYLTKDCSVVRSIYFTPTPCFSLYRLSNQFKEKWDFQFFWLWMGYRKFYGKKKEYKDSLKEKGYEIRRFCINNKKKCKES